MLVVEPDEVGVGGGFEQFFESGGQIRRAETADDGHADRFLF